MTLLEKIKINIDYLLGKADPSLYVKGYKNPHLALKDWQKRWEIFSEFDCFTWYGVDMEGNLGEFQAAETYVPETFFQDVSTNKKLQDFFDELPEITTAVFPNDLRYELKKSVDTAKNDFWKKTANKGLFVFEEPDGEGFQGNTLKTPYELLLMPEKPLNMSRLPGEIQNLLAPYYFENLKFADCQFLDVSKYLYCEE